MIAVGDKVTLLRDKDHGMVAFGTEGVVVRVNSDNKTCEVDWNVLKRSWTNGSNVVPMFIEALKILPSPPRLPLPLTTKRKLVL